jgi:geranylgeranyl diphosphate synthase type I
MLQQAVRESGAIDKVERVIARNVAKAVASLTDAPLTPSAKAELTRLADTVTRRVA